MKKIYKTPQIMVENVQPSQIVCTSDSSDSSIKTENLEEEETFEWEI